MIHELNQNTDLLIYQNQLLLTYLTMQSKDVPVL